MRSLVLPSGVPLFGLLLLPGCDLLFGKETVADYGPSCTETAHVVAVDEMTDLGFSGATILRAVSGEHAATFVWTKDQHTEPMTLTIGDTPTELRFIDSEPAEVEDSGFSDLMYTECGDRLEIDVPVRFATESGAFDESWSSTLIAYTEDTVTLSQEMDPAALGGTYDVLTDVTSTDYDTLSLGFSAYFSGEGDSGAVSGQASGSEDCDEGDDCAAWAELIDVGSWTNRTDTGMPD